MAPPAAACLLAGRAGERFAVRNSAAVAVVEGAGAIAGVLHDRRRGRRARSIGRNACAGMTGGTAYLLAGAPPAWLSGHETVVDAGMDAAATAELAALLEDHLAADRQRDGRRVSRRA